MDMDIIKTLITATGPIIGSVVTLYRDEIKAVVTGSVRSNSDLLGQWDGHWCVDWEMRGSRAAQTKQTEEATDLVEIRRAIGDKIVASAKNPLAGSYRLVGRLSESLVLTLHYEGAGTLKPLGGVVLLELAPARETMAGYWMEYTENRGFIGGRTRWAKRK